MGLELTTDKYPPITDHKSDALPTAPRRLWFSLILKQAILSLYITLEIVPETNQY